MLLIKRKKVDPDVVLLEISGRITLGRECKQVEWEVDELVRDNTTKVVFDLAELEYVDSTGIGILVMCCGKLRKAGGEMRVAAVQPRIAQLMKMTRVDEILPPYPTTAAATESFGPAK